MKAHLMYPDRDFHVELPVPQNSDDLTGDLELETLWSAMAGGDAALQKIARIGLLVSLDNPAEIIYRQQVLEDCSRHPDVVRAMYDLAVEAIAAERHVFYSALSDHPEMVLHRSVEVLTLLVSSLRQLRELTDAHGGEFRSPGLCQFFAMVASEIDDNYLESVSDHLKLLRFRDGLLMSAQLGRGNRGVGFILRQPRPENRRIMDVLTQRIPLHKPTFSYTLPERDEAGARAMGDLRDRGLGPVANAAAQSADHVLSFFGALRAELGFYVGCLNLADVLTGFGQQLCYPVPLPPGDRTISANELYEPCLAIRRQGSAIGSTLTADAAELIMITGANRGGKSTFLRSIGVAQLMLQAGMFVAARGFTSRVVSGIFTHFKREEDDTMESGKFDEELRRMSWIADRVHPGGLLLCNESFASTNEREGSEIAGQVTRAMVDTGVRVLYVTHMYDLAHTMYLKYADSSAVFLRAPRQDGESRPFQLVPGKPLPTSYGPDLFVRIFGDEPRQSADPPLKDQTAAASTAITPSTTAASTGPNAEMSG